MGAGGLALKSVQWFIRGVQFCCAAVVLALFSYFLATLSNHNYPIATWIRAVEGISGLAVLYTLAALLLLCCFAGRTVTSFLAIVLDVAFLAGFIYIASANRHGANSCTGVVDTPFGVGNADTNVPDTESGGFTNLPSFRQACQMQTACLAVSIVAIIFFVFSILMEVALARHHRKEKRFGPGPQNDYTSGSGRRRGGFFGFGRRRDRHAAGHGDNVLPEHTTPDQVRNSYNTETTAVPPASSAGPDAGYNKYGESGYGYAHGGHHTTGTTAPVAGGRHPQGQGYGYNDGVYDRV